jgi:hypothetical protein
MTQVDLGLTGLTRLVRSLTLMTVIKNLGRHSWAPPPDRPCSGLPHGWRDYSRQEARPIPRAARAALDRILAATHRAADVSLAAAPMGLDGVSTYSVSEQEV